MKHIISLLSSLWVTANLLVGVAFLVLVLLPGWIIPVKPMKSLSFFLAEKIYRFAVQMDSFWMKRVVGIRLEVEGARPIPDDAIVICNHQSWFDIPLIQDVVTANGPIVKFLVKRELVWVPIIGWICLALDFPRLHRSKHGDTRAHDLREVRRAGREHSERPGAMFLFPEGTRSTAEKRQRVQSPYTHLMPPKAGGLATLLAHTPDDTCIVDLTIDYHRPDVRIWECLHGNPRKITINMAFFSATEVDDAGEWLSRRWQEKDAMLEARR